MVDQLTIEVLEAVQQAADTCLPVPAGGGGGHSSKLNPLPGWCESVQPFKEIIYF